MKNKVINSIKNGNMTVEQIQNDTGISPKALEIVLGGMVAEGIIGVDDDGTYFNVVFETAPAPVQTQLKVTPKPINKTKKGDKMKKKQLNLTQVQADFAKYVNDNKAEIYKAEQVLIHRGAEVLFGGCGDQSFRYKMAISGFSDKEPVEYVVMYLDWDDDALYEEGGLADQIRAIVGTPAPKIKPAIQAQQ